MAKRNQRAVAPQLTTSASNGPERTQQTQTSQTRRKARKGPRTASGKKADPTLLANAGQNALDGLRQRTEQGHLKAGRTPPSQVPTLRTTGGSREVDDSIRSPYAVVTEDEKLLQQPGRFDDFTRTDPWRVLRITSEFIEGFDTLASVQKGVTVFGSARIGPDDPTLFP